MAADARFALAVREPRPMGPPVGPRPYRKPGTRAGRRLVSHRSGSARVCGSSLIELNDGSRCVGRSSRPPSPAPVTAAVASRSGSSTAEAGAWQTRAHRGMKIVA